MPQVSIAMPVYNGEKFIKSAIDSILNQTFDDFELLISDNASTDKTAEICMSYRDKRIKYYANKKNIGAVYNYNSLFYKATGQYFKWHAYDDICMPTYLEKCVKILDYNPSVVLCYPKTTYIDKNGDKICDYEDNLNLYHNKPHLRLRHLVKNINYCNAVMGIIRSSGLRQTKLFNKYQATDSILLVELCLIGKIYEIPERLFLRRDHDEMTAHFNKYQLAKWTDPTIKKLSNFPNIKVTIEKFRAIRDSKLIIEEKLLCYLQVFHWMYRIFRAEGGKYKKILKNLVLGKVEDYIKTQKNDK